jgi:hypothetical protein
MVTPPARFMQVCLDANDLDAVARFWSPTLDLPWQPDDDGYPGGFVADTGRPTGLRLERVPEPKSVKNRVHPDIYVRTLDELIRRGAAVVVPEGDDRRWTVMADVEGNEFCAFVRDDVPAAVLHGIGIDCVDPATLALWWGEVLGGAVAHNPRGFSTVEAGSYRPFTLDFAAVPEPKTVKNRMHWDVRANDVSLLLERGATLLSQPHGDAYWCVLADPEGNEFCVFPPQPGPQSS